MLIQHNCQQIKKTKYLKKYNKPNTDLNILTQLLNGSNMRKVQLIFSINTDHTMFI